jgi:hypothetical protein
MPSTFPPLSPWEGRGLGRLTVMVKDASRDPAHVEPRTPKPSA